MDSLVSAIFGYLFKHGGVVIPHRRHRRIAGQPSEVAPLVIAVVQAGNSEGATQVPHPLGVGRFVWLKNDDGVQRRCREALVVDRAPDFGCAAINAGPKPGGKRGIWRHRKHDAVSVFAGEGE